MKQRREVFALILRLAPCGIPNQPQSGHCVQLTWITLQRLIRAAVLPSSHQDIPAYYVVRLFQERACEPRLLREGVYGIDPIPAGPRQECR